MYSIEANLRLFLVITKKSFFRSTVIVAAMGKAAKTKFELAVIDRVTAMRRKKGMSQEYIADILGLTKGFIGQIESPKHASKYNLNHLNKLAEEMDCSPQVFLPEHFLSEQ